MKSFCFYLFSTKFLEINCMIFFMVWLELLAEARIFLQARAAALLEVVEPCMGVPSYSILIELAKERNSTQMHTLILKSCINLRMKENDWLISIYDTKVVSLYFWN